MPCDRNNTKRSWQHLLAQQLQVSLRGKIKVFYPSNISNLNACIEIRICKSIVALLSKCETFYSSPICLMIHMTCMDGFWFSLEKGRWIFAFQRLAWRIA